MADTKKKLIVIFAKKLVVISQQPFIAQTMPSALVQAAILAHLSTLDSHVKKIQEDVSGLSGDFALERKAEEDKKIKQWISERSKPKNKGNIDILPKDKLLSRYTSFSNEVRAQMLDEAELGCYIGRIPNFPECISENVVLHVLRSEGIPCTWKCTGDILYGESNTRGEVKCHFNGPSQFSPNKDKDGDTLFYLEAENHLYGGAFKLYKVENYNTELKKIQINKDSLLADQQDSGRRPRFTIKEAWPNIEDFLIWEGTIYDLLA